jgi:hypothetical protein
MNRSAIGAVSQRAVLSFREGPQLAGCGVFGSRLFRLCRRGGCKSFFPPNLGQLLAGLAQQGRGILCTGCKHLQTANYFRRRIRVGRQGISGHQLTKRGQQDIRRFRGSERRRESVRKHDVFAGRLKERGTILDINENDCQLHLSFLRRRHFALSSRRRRSRGNDRRRRDRLDFRGGGTPGSGGRFGPRGDAPAYPKPNVVLDLYSRAVVEWAMAERMTRELAIAALTMAVWRRRPGRGLIVRSDRGSQ